MFTDQKCSELSLEPIIEPGNCGVKSLFCSSDFTTRVIYWSLEADYHPMPPTDFVKR